MKVCKRLAVLLLCVVVLAGVAIPAGGASNVYFMAVNDKVVEMTADNMPLVVGGVLYVPYTMLSAKYSGINLGVNAQFSVSRGTVMLTQGAVSVVFNPQDDVCMDLYGGILDARAVVRNGMVYLPLAWVCEYFDGLSYSLIRTEYGTLIRVTNNMAVLEDLAFEDAARTMLRANYQRYISSIGGSQDGPGGSASQGQGNTGPLIYLAFRVDGQTEAMAQMLELNRQWGLFLFTVDELKEQDELVRRLVGSGHMVGLELTGGGEEEAAEGSRLLADIARYPLTIVSGTDGPEAGGLWKATCVADGLTIRDLLGSLNEGTPNFVEVTCDEAGTALMDRFLTVVLGGNYRLRQTVASVL